jgi:trigger factor
LEVVTEELEHRQAVVTATVDEEWLDPFMRKASRSLAARLDIPGFRRGKAPYGVVVRHAGREALVREVIDDVGRTAYEEAVAETGLEPIHLDDLEIEEWDPLTLRLTVSLPPVVELGDYHSVRLEVKPVEVGEDDVQKALQEFQEQYAEKVSVERPAQLSDFALLDIGGTVDGRAVLDLEQQEYELREDGEGVIGKFAGQVVGMSPGEEKTFDVEFADDYEDEELAGQQVSFTVRLHNLQEKHLPAIDDELAKMVGGFDSLAALRKDVEEVLYLRRQAKQQDELAEELLDRLLEDAKVDAPSTLIDGELEAMVSGLAYELQEQGFTLEGYLKTTGRDLEDLLDEFRLAAEKRVKKSLILAELIKQEGVEVEDQEVEEEAGRMTRVYGQEREVLRDALLGNERIREEIRNKLYGRTLVSILFGAGDGQGGEEEGEVVPSESPPPSEEVDSEVEEED